MAHLGFLLMNFSFSRQNFCQQKLDNESYLKLLHLINEIVMIDDHLMKKVSTENFYGKKFEHCTWTKILSGFEQNALVENWVDFVQIDDNILLIPHFVN